jgi:hypothetical protein
MCGRFVQIIDIELFIKRFGVKKPGEIKAKDNYKTSEVINSFSIITTVANPVTKLIGHHRSPVILEEKDETRWLDENLPLKEVLKLLKPYKGEEFRAVPVSIRIRNPKNKDSDLIIPVDETGKVEFDSSVREDLRLEGMGRGKREDKD